MFKCPPVLLLLFNRPQLATRVFERVRAARPARLFVAVDGPRPEIQGDGELCRACRNLVQKIDWPCEVSTLFRDRNLGCRVGVSEAISWFFESVDEGIILEDDCLPNIGFFEFCSEMLQRYRDDRRIVCIGGDCPVEKFLFHGFAYAFVTYPLIWGWATWKRAWENYQKEIDPSVLLREWLRRHLADKVATDYWHSQLESVRKGQLNSWATLWALSCWRNNGLSIVPARLLIENLGFGEDSTHTAGSKPEYFTTIERGFAGPLNHPPRVCRDFEIERAIREKKFGGRGTSGRFRKLGARVGEKLDFVLLELKRAPLRLLKNGMRRVFQIPR